jgi:threonine dehydratase
MGGRIVRVPWERWWAAVESGSPKEAAEDVEGYFVHPVRDVPVMAGNGTIGLELVEQLEDIDAVLIPWGGGGLTTGIASALHALSPETKVYVCEPETGAPVTAAIANGGVPTRVDFTPSFVDGAGSGSLLPEVWEHARPLVTGAFPISLEDVASTIRLLLERGRILAEGAAALPVAAALAGRAGSGRLVCIVSGGNIDTSRLTEILAGRIPD